MIYLLHLNLLILSFKGTFCVCPIYYFTDGLNLSLGSWVRYTLLLLLLMYPSGCRKNKDFVVKLRFQYWFCHLSSWNFSQITSLRSIHFIHHLRCTVVPLLPRPSFPFSFTVILRYNLHNIKYPPPHFMALLTAFKSSQATHLTLATTVAQDASVTLPDP